MKHKILATLFLIASSLFSSKTASACTPTPVYSQYTVRSNDTSTIYQNVQVTGYSSCADSMNSFTHTPYISNFITMGLNGDYSDMSVTTALATDNFAYSSGELHIVSASKWTANVGQMSVVSGGVVEGTSSPTAYYYTAFPNAYWAIYDQWSQATLATNNANTSFDVCVRIGAVGQHGRYLFRANDNGVGTYRLYKYSATGALVALSSQSAQVPAVNDVMWIGVSGPNILAKVNGVIILNAVDTELTGGQVGIGGTNTSIGATTGRNWSGGGFGSASAAPVGYDLYHTPASFAYYGPLAYNKSRQTIQITTNASGKAGIASQHVGVQPGENISASTQGAVISGTGSASLSLLFEDSSGNVIQTNTVSTVAHPSNGGLTTLSLAVAAPTGAAYAQSTIYASTANMVVVFGQHSVDKYNNAYGASTCPSCNVNHSVNLSAKFPPMPTAPSGQTSDPMWSITYNLGNRSSILCTGLGDFWGHPWDSITFEVELAFTVSQDVGPWPNGRRVLASPATCVAYPPDYNPTNAITDQPPPNYWWQTGIAIRPGIYGWKTAWLSTPGVSLPYPFTLPYRCTNKDAGIYSPIQYPWPI